MLLPRIGSSSQRAKACRVLALFSLVVTGTITCPAATTASLIRTFENPFPDQQDRFSLPALIGNTLFVGAPLDDTVSTNSGAVYAFSASTGDLLSTFTTPAAVETTYSLFGFNLTADETGLLYVAAPGRKFAPGIRGSICIYNGATLTPVGTVDKPSTSTATAFGVSLAAAENRLLVGATDEAGAPTDPGKAYLYTSAGSLLAELDNPQPASNFFFGYSVALGGGYALVGAPGDSWYTGNVGASQSGAAHLYDAQTGAYLHSFQAPSPQSGDGFGAAVALTPTGLVCIGAPFDQGASFGGTLHIFRPDGQLLHSMPEPNSAITGFFASSLAAVPQTSNSSQPGEKVLAGSGGSQGTAYVINVDYGFATMQMSNPLAGDPGFFGVYVGATPDYLLVGAPNATVSGVPNAGALHLFQGVGAAQAQGGWATYE